MCLQSIMKLMFVSCPWSGKRWILTLLMLVTCLVEGVQCSLTCKTYLTVSGDSSGLYKYKDTIHFSCKVLNTTHIVGSKFFLSKNGTKILFTNIIQDTGHVDVKVVSKEVAGTYSCHYDNCSVDTLLSALAIKVDECSFPMQGEPKMSCIVNDLDNMTCDWKVAKNETCTSWKAVYKLEEMDSYQCCTVNRGGSNCIGSSPQCFIPSVYKYLTYNISLTRLTGQTQSTDVYNYSVVPDNSIVRVDLDSEVHVYKGSDAHTLVVGFTAHHPPAAVGNMICNVSAMSEWDHSKKSLNSSHKMIQESLDLNISVDGLTPYTNYTINILCHPQPSPYWSNVVTGCGRTRPQVCERVPDIIGYSDVPADTSGQREIYLYIKPLPKKQLYGSHTAYLLSVTNHYSWYLPLNLTMADTQEVNTSQLIPADRVTVKVKQRVPKGQVYTLMISTVNEMGESNISAKINVLSFDSQEVSSIRVVIEEAYGTSYVILFLACEDDVDSATYYNCQGETSQAYPSVCTTEIKKKTVSRFMKTFTLFLEPPNLGYTWYYGVSIKRIDTPDSKRLVWSNCVFLQSVADDSVTEQLDISTSLLPSNNSVVMVVLHFDYCQLRRRPLSYHIGFWKTGLNYSNYCKNNIQDLYNFTATPVMKELPVYIGNMVNVTVCLRVQYREQFDVSKDVNLAVLQPNASPQSNDTDVTVIVLAVVCPLTIIMVALFVVFFRRRIIYFCEKNKVKDDVIANILRDCPTEDNITNPALLKYSSSAGISIDAESSTVRSSRCKISDPDRQMNNCFDDTLEVEEIEQRVASTSCCGNSVDSYLVPKLDVQGSNIAISHTNDDASYLVPTPDVQRFDTVISNCNNVEDSGETDSQVYINSYSKVRESYVESSTDSGFHLALNNDPGMAIDSYMVPTVTTSTSSRFEEVVRLEQNGQQPFVEYISTNDIDSYFKVNNDNYNDITISSGCSEAAGLGENDPRNLVNNIDGVCSNATDQEKGNDVGGSKEFDGGRRGELNQQVPTGSSSSCMHDVDSYVKQNCAGYDDANMSDKFGSLEFSHQQPVDANIFEDSNSSISNGCLVPFNSHFIDSDVDETRADVLQAIGNVGMSRDVESVPLTHAFSRARETSSVSESIDEARLYTPELRIQSEFSNNRLLDARSGQNLSSCEEYAVAVGSVSGASEDISAVSSGISFNSLITTHNNEGSSGNDNISSSDTAQTVDSYQVLGINSIEDEHFGENDNLNLYCESLTKVADNSKDIIFDINITGVTEAIQEFEIPSEDSQRCEMTILQIRNSSFQNVIDDGSGRNKELKTEDNVYITEDHLIRALEGMEKEFEDESEEDEFIDSYTVVDGIDSGHLMDSSCQE